MIKEGKQGQFYLIAAVIIILVILGLVGVKNYVSIKKEPTKFQDFSDMLGLEGRYGIEYAVYNKDNSQTISQDIINLSSEYLKSNYNEDFVLYVIYGDITGENIQATKISKESQGDITASLGGSLEVLPESATTVNPRDVTLTINPGEPKTVTVNLTVGETVISQTLPILDKNNFVFAMTTSKGLSQYITTNL